MRTFGTALLVLASTFAFGQAGDSKPIFISNVRVVVRPGQVLDATNLVIENGKIRAIGKGVTAPAGAETIDATGLTAYAGFIHPMLRTPIEGVPAGGGGNQGGGPGGGGGGGGQRPQLTTAEANAAQAKRDADPFGLESNVLSKIATSSLKQKNVALFSEMAKSGFTLANLSASGGLLGPSSAVVNLGSPELSATSFISNPGTIPINFSSRGFGSYPSSTMGAIAVIRQALFDAQRYSRMKITGRQPADDVALNALSKVTDKTSWAVFDGLNEVSFLQAKKLADELGLKSVFGFRSDAGIVADLLQRPNQSVLLKGVVPLRPSIGANLDSMSINGFRGYFREIQAANELERLGVPFSYAPESTVNPLEGLRTYVRAGFSRSSALASLTTCPAELLGISGEAGTIETSKRADIVLVQGDIFDTNSQIMAVFAGGKRVDFPMPSRKLEADLKPDSSLKLVKPNNEFFPSPAESTHAFRLYKNATVWTQGPMGTLKNTDVVIRNGKIIAVGRGIKPVDGCETIDATGKHISPGIWDCHSHTGISGGVNEGSNMVTVECRISDVINHRAPNIYQQLSGGTVGAMQLHGSANAIGGQSSPVKWRWGQRSSDYPVEGAPAGVKFALGQNPIREDPSGGGGQPQPVGTTLLTWRPRTRMGVEESIRRALQLGKEYNQTWADYRAGKTTIEPRRDVQLEGLGEIVSGKRLIHSHGYRADELLMLIRVASEYGAKIATLQHVLEGYKIADEMATAGIGGSTFSDWWGYKLEAYDAIPYNAALMAERGVSVSVNSDSDNHARRLNIEGAKSMRNGGVSPEVALSFVTIEPAKQMGIANRTGSLEVGKDADLAIWTADPTSIFAVCLETYVDGVKRFDRANDAKQRADREAELKEAQKLLAATTESDEGNPFNVSITGASTTAASNGTVTKSTATFGIGPIASQPGTSKYPRKAVLLSGGTVHPMDGAPFIGDVLLGADGRIAKVGTGLSASGATRVDCKGKHVYPGLIDPATSIGLNEIGQVPTSDDSSERGDFHPDYRVERTINPEWETMGVARQQGVLTVLVKPSGGGFSGQAALIHTEGYTWEDYTIAGGVGMMVSGGGGGFNFGEEHRHDDGDLLLGTEDCCNTSGAQRGGGGGGSITTALSSLDTRFKEAREYEKKRAEATAEKPVVRDQRQEAILLVTSGKMPVILSASSASDIKSAVEWAEKEKVRLMLYGCSGAGEIADWLAKKQVPICLSAVFSMPGGELPVDSFYSLPAKLSKAGVKFCLTTDNDKDVRQIRDQAGWAAAYGLDREEAARLITLRAAEVLGISDRLGAIKPGMDGTVIVTDGEIIEIKTQVLRAFIQSREVDLKNRQTRLYEKYKGRPKGK